MNIADALKLAATRDIEVGPLHWRIVAVSSSSMLDAGAAVLLSVAKERAPGTEPAAGEQVRGAQFFEAVCAAGVRAASRDGVTWEDIRVTTVEGGAGVPVSALPPGTVQVLASAILELSKGGADGGERLASFLGAPTTDASRRRGGVPRGPVGGA